MEHEGTLAVPEVGPAPAAQEPPSRFDPVAYVHEALERSAFWNAGWEALNGLLNVHQPVTRHEMRRMVALVLVAAEDEGEREDAEHLMEDVLEFYGWSLIELTMTPVERKRAAMAATGTEVEIINANGLRPRRSTVTARALKRFARGAARITPTHSPAPAPRKHQHRAATQTRRGPPADDDPEDSSHDLTASPSAHLGSTLSLGALTRGPFVVVHRVTVHRPTDLLNHAHDCARGVVAAWAPSTNKEFPMPSRHIARVIGPTAYAARATAQETKAKTNAVTKAKVHIKTPTVRGVAWARP